MGEPILVTGVPRSGTTWVARLLATAHATSLAGREPMNPRGKQFALAGSVDAWTRLSQESPAQRRVLRRAYGGREPRVYSRYGRRQWAASLPWSRVVVKDPFALLSIPTLVRVTSAVPVVVHRHPAAVLASYRRMGWSPDLEEVAAVVARTRTEVPHADLSDVPVAGLSEAGAMGVFWRSLHELFLLDSATVPSLVVVAHEELVGNEATCRALLSRLSLRWSPATEAELAHEESSAAAPSTTLHDFNRSPRQVNEGWRRHVAAEEIEEIEALTSSVRSRLDALSLA